MGQFAITLDNTFDELINKHKNNKISIEDLINIKSSLKIAYYNDNNEDNNFIKGYLKEISFNI
jgi:hypothetical protein